MLRRDKDFDNLFIEDASQDAAGELQFPAAKHAPQDRERAEAGVLGTLLKLRQQFSW